MRTILLCISAGAIAAFAACGGDDGNKGVDAPASHPPPRVIAGGGIGDGPIDGVANLYVIDDATRTPIANATVRVGTVDGTTDATGLFVATGVTGKQTVVATAPGYEAQLWVGANGANLTMNLGAAVDPAPAQATLSGQITGFGAITVAANHVKLGVVTYSQSDALGDAANNLQTPASGNVCIAAGSDPCPFTVVARTGQVGLVAAILDRDTKGTSDPDDDTQTLIRWAYRGGLTVAGGVNQTGQDLALVDATQLDSVTVDFGAPPSELATVGAVVGIDLGAAGTFQLPLVRTPADPSLLVPRPAAVGGTAYRLTGIASDGAATNPKQSFVLRRGLGASPLAAGAWLPLPAGATASAASAAWQPVSGADLASVEWTQGTATATKVLNATVFDGSASVTVPELVHVPAGALTAKFQAIAAPELDVNDFALDADREKLTAVSALPIAVAN
jgi:hypothetical protein